MTMHIYTDRYSWYGYSWIWGWVFIACIINMLILNIPMLLCWVLLTGGWKKFNSYNCGDKFAKLFLILSASAYSLIATAALIIAIIRWWAAGSSLSDYYDFVSLSEKVFHLNSFLRFFYSCEICVLALWALWDTHQNVEKIRAEGGKLKCFFGIWTLLQIWYTINEFMIIIYVYKNTSYGNNWTWCWNSAQITFCIQMILMQWIVSMKAFEEIETENSLYGEAAVVEVKSVDNIDGGQQPPQ